MTESPPSNRVLVVDDQDLEISVMQRALRFDSESNRLAPSVDWERTCAGAISKVRAHTYSLIILDLGLGSDSGFEVAEAVRGTEAGRESLIVLNTTGRVETHTLAIIDQLGIQLNGERYQNRSDQPEAEAAKLTIEQFTSLVKAALLHRGPK